MGISVSSFLLEIGTEELPADFARLALLQLEQMVSRDLKQHHVEFGSIHCTSTPRRIVVLVEDIASVSKDLEEDRKGPPATNAFTAGKPTQAAIGFASRIGIPVEALEIRETPKGPFVFAKLTKEGVPAIELLGGLIPQWIGNLQGRRFMRWGEGSLRFPRPVRWLLALLGQKVVPVTLKGSDPLISSGNLSFGHRLYGNGEPFPITSAEAYLETLAKGGVVVDRKERISSIRKAIDSAASSIHAFPDLPEELLEELTDLVEAPLLVEGEIPESFLELPAEVLSTVMRVHQRYVPLYRQEALKDPLALDARKTIHPRFLCISNGLKQARDEIKKGNERVLKARLSDAKFFVEVDRGITSESRVEKLETVTFAEGLGSLLDRVKRMGWLADLIIDQLNFDDAKANHLRRAVLLCKHDLVSQMVGEFPELQGVIGAKYLIAEGESSDVALAVLEHYQPRGAGAVLPESDAGAALAIVERLELLLSIFAKGERPSGSSDPYALRRAGNGLLQILWSKGWKVNLIDLFSKASINWMKIFPGLEVNSEVLCGDLVDFLRQRILTLLDELGVDIDLAQAVAGETIPSDRILSDPEDLLERANLLVEMRQTGGLQAVQMVVTRAARLAEKGNLPKDLLSPLEAVDTSLFEKPSEFGMLEVLKGIEPILQEKSLNRYRDLTQRLIEGSKALEAFFDGEESVLVMAEDLAVRQNRLNLLGVLRNQAGMLADFSRIVS